MNILDRKQLSAFGSLDLLAHQVVEGFITGLHKSPNHGFSVEFAEHRLYNKGQSTKHIDWKLFARTEKLFIKRYEEETNLRCQILIDNSSSMLYPKNSEFPNKLEFSSYAAASIIELMKRQRDAVSLSIFNEGIELKTETKSSASHQRYLYHEIESRLLNPTEEKKSSSTVEALHQIANTIHRRSLVVVFSDMFDSNNSLDEIMEAFQHLKHNKHELIVFHVMERQTEKLLDLENRPYAFTDMETGEQVKLNPQSIQKNYQESVLAYQKELKNRCGQYKIDFVEADINEGFYPVLLQFLIKRSKL